MADTTTAQAGTEANTNNQQAAAPSAAASDSGTQVAATAAAGGGTTLAATTTEGATQAASAVTDWRAGLEGEHKDFADRLASPHDAVKVALDLRKANSSMVRVPGAGAKPEDVQKFHKAIGVPEKPEDYKFDIGREPTDQDKAIQGQIAKVFHQNGVPATAATAVSKAVAELAAAQLDEQNRVAVGKRDEAAAALRKEWGADAERNAAVATRAVSTFGGDGLKEFLDTTIVNGSKLGDHPVLVKAFAQIGLRMGEGEFIGAVTQADKESMAGELRSLMKANPPGSDGYRNPQVQNRLRELNSALYGNAPIVGQGRAA